MKAALCALILTITALARTQAACVVNNGVLRCDDTAQPYAQSTASLQQQQQQYLLQQQQQQQLAQLQQQQQHQLLWQQQQQHQAQAMGQTGFGPFAGQMPQVPMFQQTMQQAQPAPLLNPTRQQALFAPVIQTAQATVVSAPVTVPQQSCQQIFASGAIEWSALASCPAAPIGSTSFSTNDAAPEHDFAAVGWASERGWSMRLVSAHDRNKELKDPLDFLAQLQEDVHVRPAMATPVRSDWIEVEVNDEAATAFSVQGLADEWAVKAAADQVFDAEHSEFEAAGSGWSDPAIVVETDLGPCRGQLQPGHLIYCATPGSRVTISVLAKNTGKMPWIASGQNTRAAAAAGPQGMNVAEAAVAAASGAVSIQMNLLDALQWTNPLTTPLDVLQSMQAGMFGAAAAEAAAAPDADVESMRGAMHSLLLVANAGPIGGTCVAPGETGLFSVQLTAPSGATSPLPLGLHGLRLTPTGPCGPMTRPLRVNIDVTCSDGLFCNGLEQWVDGACQRPSSNMTIACDDRDPCTVDACDEALGRCTQALLNTTACMQSVCGGDKCVRACAAGAQCGSDGCGGVCGLCQSGESCADSTKTCVAQSQAAGSCLNPYDLPVFTSLEQQAAWTANPSRFSRPSLPATELNNVTSFAAALAMGSTALPSELSRHIIRIPNVVEGGFDSLSPTCVSFGEQPDFVYRFVVPENAAVNPFTHAPAASASAAATAPAGSSSLDIAAGLAAAGQGFSPDGAPIPIAMNIDPLSSSTVTKPGFVAVDIQAYGKYNPRLDTVVEIRGAPGVFSTAASGSASRLSSVGNLDPVYACLEDRSKANGSMIHPGEPAAPFAFTLQNSKLEQARRWALGLSTTTGEPMDAAAAAATPGSNAHPIRPYSQCIDNTTPPGGLGSRLSVLLPPGTYYLAISTFPTFNIPANVQAIQDAAAGPVPADMREDQAHEVEAVVRFLSGYLPDCTNVECGDDAGGNECGRGCESGMRCSKVSNKCVSAQCTPRCEGRSCGSDGCEGSCGQCSLTSIDAAKLAATPNALGRPFKDSDVFCLQERDPALVPLRRVGDRSTALEPLGPSVCALMPEQCDGARPICKGLRVVGSDGVVHMKAGCPAGSFCANDCACRPLDAALPDLLVKMDALVTQLSVSQYAFSPRSCSLVEHCISRPGVRKLLRFSVAIINQGAADLKLPEPKSKPDDFIYSPCHHHYHYHHFADYSLIKDGQVKLRGHKQAFCLEDSMQETIGSKIPCLAHHTCTQPGIQKGWSDYYGADLDCQWIDVSSVDPGRYLLRVEVNSARSLFESTFENNVVTLAIDIP